MNDDVLVDWLLDQGYGYDFDKEDWVHKSSGESVESREERLTNPLTRNPGEPSRDPNKLKGLRAGFIDRTPLPGSYLDEIKKAKEDAKESLKEAGAIAGIYSDPLKTENLKREVQRKMERKFSPLFSKSKTTSNVFDKVFGYNVDKVVDEEANKVKAYQKTLLDVRTEDILDNIQKEIEKNLVSPDSLAKNIAKAQSRLFDLESRRDNFEKVWDPDKIIKSNYKTVQSLLGEKPFGFLPDRAADVDRLRKSLETKGFEILPADKRGKERIRFIGKK
ncbi:hypothetical protein KY326_01685 [Candidatus Woesearchaeota archaeon]|nr:hypothetical protein [Candidatus Woesearchaeota archaeon]